jgi:hypothetical protein
VELLRGASSALYGANAFNGILFMTSQSPFTSQGLLRMQNLDKQVKLLGQTTMLIMELEWRMRLVQNLPQKLTLPICAVQIGMLQNDDKTNVGETEVM